MSDSYNHIFKQSVNAFHNELISGGSSGGEGALVGVRGSIVGIGTDIGGKANRISIGALRVTVEQALFVSQPTFKASMGSVLLLVAYLGRNQGEHCPTSAVGLYC